MRGSFSDAKFVDFKKFPKCKVFACKDLKGGGAAEGNLEKTRLKSGASLAVGG